MNTHIVPTIERAENGELTVSSLTIAEQTDNKHASILRLIDDNFADFEDFGTVGFEIRPLPGGGNPQRVAHLNEPQSTLLLTYLRNNEKVRTFKKGLVKGFYVMAKQLQDSVPAEIAPELLMAKALVQADGIMKQQGRELEAARPAVEYHERYVSNEDAIIVAEFAAQHGLSSLAMFKLLRDKKVVYRTKVTEHFSRKRDRVVDDNEHRAYAGYLKFFDLRPQHNVVRYHNGQLRQTLYVRQAFALELASLIGLNAETVTTKELF